MEEIDTRPKVLTNLSISIDPAELGDKIQAGKKKQEFVDTAQALLESLENCWNPAIVYRWLPASINASKQGGCSLKVDDQNVSLELGHSSVFIQDAELALVACYRAGDSIEKESRNASENGRLLDSYLLDIINLLILEKTGYIINAIAEDEAKKRNWGVSPFLSPGSVHGWELEEQHKFAGLLPLTEIDVEIRPDAVLLPFKSLTCLIGIGEQYSATSVGTTCQVCSQNETCQMRQE